ncbi:MAG: hypothetical protein ACO3HJ_00055 [Methylophilaceae bacterium]
METEVMTSVVETLPIWLNPLAWIVGLLVVVAIVEAVRGGFYSPKPQKANKTSTPQKRKTAKKKTAKKTATKKATRKRTPKKSGN